VQTRKYFQFTKSFKDLIKIIRFIYSKLVLSLDTPTPKNYYKSHSWVGIKSLGEEAGGWGLLLLWK
jgi:hypothetical protein